MSPLVENEGVVVWEVVPGRPAGRPPARRPRPRPTYDSAMTITSRSSSASIAAAVVSVIAVFVVAIIAVVIEGGEAGTRRRRRSDDACDEYDEYDDDDDDMGGGKTNDDANDIDDRSISTSTAAEKSGHRPSSSSIASSSSSSSTSNYGIVPPLHPIGTLSSIYRLCVGTPRQGMLVPHSRGVINFDEDLISHDAIMELGGYSHVYVVFAFHLNSNANARECSFGKDGAVGTGMYGDGTMVGGGDGDDVRKDDAGGDTPGSSSSSTPRGRHRRKRHRQFPSKIAPPSLGGRKVGIFSTRTPHRPNPIGISLCRLDGICMPGNTPSRKGGKEKGHGRGRDMCRDGGEGSSSSSSSSSSSFSLLISGVDLVDGTPILDIKPYVPQYDCVGYNDHVGRRLRAYDVCDDDVGDAGVDRGINDGVGGGINGGGIGGDDRGIESASFPSPRRASTGGGGEGPRLGRVGIAQA
jgi:tRNA (Thr-GGU) A37 N-methylase